MKKKKIVLGSVNEMYSVPNKVYNKMHALDFDIAFADTDQERNQAQEQLLQMVIEVRKNYKPAIIDLIISTQLD